MSIWLIAIFLGLVEGLTEFIPVSSTGHLLIAEHFLGAGGFFKTELYNAVIQCGAVLAALPLFRDRLKTLGRWREPVYRDYFVKLGAAFLITAAGGLLMKKLGLRLPESVLPVALALLVGGIAFIVVERMIVGRKCVVDVSWSVAIAIGVAQLVAVAFPGTSRSGATILFALALGLGRGPATEFSFLLGVPTLCAAGALKLLESIKLGGAVLEQSVGGVVVKSVLPIEWGPLVVSCIVAAVSSVVAVKWMLGYVQSHTFTGFGLYRVALAVLLLVLHVA
jgi:undecaprenyl-diphosphatase